MAQILSRLIRDTLSTMSSDEASCHKQDVSLQVTLDNTLALLQECRNEKDVALRLLNARTVELSAAQKELASLKEKFNALQSSLEPASPGRNSGDGMSSLEGHTLLSRHCCNRETKNDAVSPLPTHHAQSSPTPSSNLAGLAGCKLGPERGSLSRGGCSTTALALPTPPSSPSSHGSRLPSPTVVERPLFRLRRGYVSSSSDGCGDSVVSAASEKDTHEAASSNDVRSIVDLRALVDDALAGQLQSTARLKQFYEKALSTPCKDRLPTEEYVILEWGKTIKLDPVTTPRAPISHPPPVKPPEIFVDASGWGIGFVCNGRWLAWKLKPGWQKGGKDNNWSEAIAVELGLYVAISSGFKNCKVKLRSDHSGVVQALETEKSKNSPRGKVIERIVALKQTNGIDLAISWIPTGQNPADKPSRGKFPAKELLFPGSIPVPPHLSPYVCPPIDLSSLS